MKIRKALIRVVIALIFINLFSTQLTGQNVQTELPKIPSGLDSYRMWENWPQQRIGVRAYMRSTYDRRGGNENADAGHFLFANEETNNVTLDVKGKGILYFFRSNHWHGSPWHFIVDGNDNIVEETGTSDPENAKKLFSNPEFIPRETFPSPLNYTWAITKGADLIWTPIPFQNSLRIAYSRTHYGTGYYIYHQYADESNLSQPLLSWDINQAPGLDVLHLIERSGTDIAPMDIERRFGKIKLNKERILISNIEVPSKSAIRAFKMTIPMEKAIDLERLHLIITWDKSENPSVDAPVCLFFGAGTFYNRDDKEYLVKAFPVNVRFDFSNNQIELGCYFPMPFYESAKFELKGIEPDDTEIFYEIRYEFLKPEKKLNSYFHATYKNLSNPEPGKDLVFLDTKGIEGAENWSGSFVGTSFIFSHNGALHTLEGDPRFFLDDSETPNYGTGTEEWAGGGDYWGGSTMTLPFAGHPVGCPPQRLGGAKNSKDSIQSAYRFLLADLMPFGRRAVIQFEHGGENLSMEHYEAVTYWYGIPSPALLMTDELNIGNAQSEWEHEYLSTDASTIQSIISRYEWGIDKFPEKLVGGYQIPVVDYEDIVGTEVYAPHIETGRYTRGISEFKVKLDPENEGALLRRTLDYSFPNQTAEIFIADASSGQSLRNAEWKYAGIWYTAGANICIYAPRKGELAKRELEIQISNRRFRDDEFLLASSLTKGKSAIWVKIRFVPDDQELFPGTPFPKESAWSELRYKVYSYVIPEFFKLLD